MKPRRIFAVLAIAASLTFGCAPKNLPKAGQANYTITTVIADAGTIAIQAEQQYQAGTIPQSDTTRNLINDLGRAYNDAKQVYTAYLMAYAEYGTAQQRQIQACTPGGTVDAGCQLATGVSTAAKAKLDTSQSNLDVSISALTTKTNAVKAITKK